MPLLPVISPISLTSAPSAGLAGREPWLADDIAAAWEARARRAQTMALLDMTHQWRGRGCVASPPHRRTPADSQAGRAIDLQLDPFARSNGPALPAASDTPARQARQAEQRALSGILARPARPRVPERSV
ncbi:MAG: hypothetical protein ACYDAG_17315 [Chloroflexota bacterium]